MGEQAKTLAREPPKRAKRCLENIAAAGSGSLEFARTTRNESPLSGVAGTAASLRSIPTFAPSEHHLATSLGNPFLGLPIQRKLAEGAANAAPDAAERLANETEPPGRPHFPFAHIPVFGGNAVAEPGQIVPNPLRTQFERVTGASVDDTRVHTGLASQQTAEDLQALAFTVGRDIHFAKGQFQPGTTEGDRLLAHELTHTVQQRAFAPVAQRQTENAEPEQAAESEADVVADAVLDDDEDAEAPVISERPQSLVLTKPKKKKKPAVKKPAKPKPITFKLFSDKFNASIDAANNVTIAKAGKKDGGWTFTANGPNQVKAERTLDHTEYVHAGGATDPLVERCTITVLAGGPATVTPITAELASPPILTIPLTHPKSAPRKSVTVNGAAVEQLDLAAGALTFNPVDGDSIRLGMGGDDWVFSTIKQDSVTPPATQPPDVAGFFRVGYFTSYKGQLGVGAASSVSDADRKKVFDDLTQPTVPASRRITTDEAERLKTVSLIESDLGGVQTYDKGILSFGFAQWTVNADLPRLLKRIDTTTFERFLGRYGLTVATPVRQLDAFVHQFVGANRQRLGVRNRAEGALFLNNKELVNEKLLSTAATRGPALQAVATQSATIKGDIVAATPDLKATDPKKKAAAVKVMKDAKTKLRAIDRVLAGLDGMKAVKDLEAHADLLTKVASDGKAACDDLAANCETNEILRGEEWALRFEMLGQSPGGQDAQISEVRANWAEVSSMSSHGAAFTDLLPNLRGQSALLSSFLNTHTSTQGVNRAVEKFKQKKQAEATAVAAAAAKAKQPAPTPTPADWNAFPWPSMDSRWTTLWSGAVVDEFEEIAVIELTNPTTDPARRRAIIKSQFP